MNRTVRIAIAVGVVGGGIGLAMFLGRPSTQNESPPPEVATSQESPPQAAASQELRPEAPSPREAAPQRTQLLGRIGPPPSGGAYGSSSAEDAALAPQRSSQVLTRRSEPFVEASAQPSLAPSVTRPARPEAPTSPWAPASSELTDGDRGAAARPRTHTIRDGDTLTYLADRYLGSSQRHLEIFGANRDVLEHPDLLPIGLKLKIPSGQRAATSIGTAVPTGGHMVPLPRRVRSRLGG